MATREVEFPTAAATDDNYRGSLFLTNTYDVEYETWVGPATKEIGACSSYHRLNLDIPIGSVTTRAKIHQTVYGDWPEVNFPLLKVCVLEPDGKWDYIADNKKSFQDELHFISQVRDTVDAQIFTTSLIYNGPDVRFLDSSPSTNVDCGSYGMKFKASGSWTLGNVIARIWRGDLGDRPGLNTYCKIYSPVSASDPRPGVLLATSDPVLFNDIPIDLTATPPDAWPEWEFSGDDRIPISDGAEYVYTIEFDNDYPGAGWIWWVTDDDRSGEPEEDQGNLPVADVWAIWNKPTIDAWGFGFYANHDMMPIAVLDGTGHTVNFKPAVGKDLNGGDSNTWGDAGYSCDATIGLAALIQAAIDDPRYDPTGDGTALGICVKTANPNIGSYISYRSKHWWEDYDGMTLTVEYTEPLPTKATNPDPPHLATGVAYDAELSWTAGTYAGTGAVTHDVYFGTDPSPGIDEFQGNQADTSFTPPSDLISGETYYWRIDSVCEFGKTTGDVWQFTVEMPELPEPTALTRPLENLVSRLGDGLRKPATPDLVPVLPEGLEVPETPELRVSPHPALEVPQGVEFRLTEVRGSGSATALEADQTAKIEDAEPDVALKTNRGKLE